MLGQRKYRTINTHTALTADRGLTGEVTTAGENEAQVNTITGEDTKLNRHRKQQTNKTGNE